MVEPALHIDLFVLFACRALLQIEDGEDPPRSYRSAMRRRLREENVRLAFLPLLRFPFLHPESGLLLCVVIVCFIFRIVTTVLSH